MFSVVIGWPYAESVLFGEHFNDAIVVLPHHDVLAELRHELAANSDIRYVYIFAAVALAILLGVVALSYRMIVMAYPTGGGSYSVSKATFGKMPSR